MFFAQKEKKENNKKNRKVTKMKKEMNLKKQIFLRGLLGIPLGITIGYLITIVLSLVWGNGYYSPCVPSLASIMGSEIGAVVLQTALCALLGVSFGATSVIWQIEHWGIVKQTGIYFLGCILLVLDGAYPGGIPSIFRDFHPHLCHRVGGTICPWQTGRRRDEQKTARHKAG